MTSFRIVHSAVHAAVAGLFYWVFQNIDVLQGWIANYKEYAIPAVLTILAFLFRSSDALSNAIIEKIPGFSRALRRTLGGKEFIEGDWPLVVVDMDKLAPLYFGFLRIEHRDGQPYVHGDDWTVDGSHAHAFHSVQSLYSDHLLQYWYKQGASAHEPDMRGYTEIFFFPKRALAERHAGKFLDPKHTSDIRFYARKRRYRFFERRLGDKDKDRKLDEARGLWTEIAPNVRALRDRKISADFA